MASKALASSALLLSLNLLFFTMVSSTNVPDCSPARPSNSHNNNHSPATKPSPNPKPSCPRDTIKLGVCANLLKQDLVHLVIGKPPKNPCCTLIEGLADLEAAVCLCTAIKANVLGLNLNIPVSLSLLLNYCGKNVPSEYQCA
ncbi:14 kDa proline-rich protein DC2.15 [Ziziphus jujuba]|uniref:14 kDa proline-rich protein DC2.15 n=2 Tax=Ziziphus jujuba TaxID=326968 RepID=A0A6P4BCA4_ZIZJJ|nr:14 kDa proline-rich protein DC2.15 [Ziziphus jujuba]KAH7514143.1 hypothetical protein FEM48_Zijuj11G0057500 [Ziziphus jujuba var. spinosa]